MNVILENIRGNQFITEMLISNLFITLPHRKRNGHRVRIAAFLICAEVLSALVMNAAPAKNIWQNYVVISSCIYVLVFAALSVCFICFCCPVSRQEAVYCAALSLCVQHFASSFRLLLDALIPGEGYLFEFLLWAGTLFAPCILFYFFCIRKICEQGTYQVSVLNLTSATCLIFLVSALISIVAKGVCDSFDNPLFLISQVYEMLCCLFLLWIQVKQMKALALQQELDIQNYLQHLRHEQAQQSKEDMGLLTHLMHKLTHQVADAIAEDRLNEQEKLLLGIEKNLLIYDKSVNTKNETLNTALLERNLFCRANDISWMVVADGERLNFMKADDIYLIFRNALDNAIEAVCKLEDLGRRIIDVRVFVRQQLLIIQIENDFAGELQFEDGLPLTTKKDKGYHGFGLKTVRQAVERYGGQMTVQEGSQRFALQIVIPIPMI